jgi:hypothetical protein
VRHQQYELAQDLLSEQNQALLEFAKESLGKKQAKQIQDFLAIPVRPSWPSPKPAFTWKRRAATCTNSNKPWAIPYPASSARPNSI